MMTRQPQQHIRISTKLPRNLFRNLPPAPEPNLLRDLSATCTVATDKCLFALGLYTLQGANYTFPFR